MTNTIDSTTSSNISKKTPIIISLNGNIGSGKSTILEQLKKFYKDLNNHDICFVQEPVDEWKKVVDSDGTQILANFYKNPKKYAFRFQMMAYISRLKLLRDAIKNSSCKILITERCVNTDRYVFKKMLYDSGQIDEDEHIIYDTWHDEFVQDVPISGIIYIKASPEICIERINCRAREGETISFDYIQSCDKYHDDWLLSNSTQNLLVLDGNVDSKNNSNHLNNHLNKINDFIYSLL